MYKHTVYTHMFGLRLSKIAVYRYFLTLKNIKRYATTSTQYQYCVKMTFGAANTHKAAVAGAEVDCITKTLLRDLSEDLAELSLSPAHLGKWRWDLTLAEQPTRNSQVPSSCTSDVVALASELADLLII